MPFLTAKTPRARREQAVIKKKEEFDQVVEQVTDAILKVHRPLGPLF
jgi:phenylpyruvate tautomerase PptA (4-oxalocrotonate tautomerase family)